MGIFKRAAEKLADKATDLVVGKADGTETVEKALNKAAKDDPKGSK